MIRVTNTKERLESIVSDMFTLGMLEEKWDSPAKYPNITYNFSRGRKYFITNMPINPKGSNSLMCSNGTHITIQYQGNKYAFLGKRYFNTLGEAVYIGSLWTSLVMNSSCYWGYKNEYENMYVYEVNTRKLVAEIRALS